MDFGMIPYDGLQKSDFLLPSLEQPYLPGTRAANLKMHIGFPKWSHEKWAGQFYPPTTHVSDTLIHYAAQFNTLEFNATHYKFFPDTQYEKWLNKVYGNDFTFCPKFPQAISHKGKITPASKAAETDLFLNGIITLREKLGPAFLQVSEYTRIGTKTDILNYLSCLPTDLLIFLETRHKSWFDSPETMRTVAKELHDLGRGWVITDTIGVRQTAHMHLSIPKAFIRFVCWGDQDLDIFRINQWKEVLTEWYAKGLQECWFFLHMQNEEAARDFSELVKLELEGTIN
jgi:uncharacterized protein YecE (DUF72 family)